ncbi:hypothetical protein Nepgr_006527 [Nepenthes gracilis]|uniref:Uncharacterized protein n=1 Tax=Nepenthes gracilis TaxID=150966 RepID=A0AAD3S556_NEPGR|nr:hypothetical protein Nepgr_006527 [Nepenthes gracilis]
MEIPSSKYRLNCHPTTKHVSYMGKNIGNIDLSLAPYSVICRSEIPDPNSTLSPPPFGCPLCFCREFWTMASLSNSLVFARNSPVQRSSGSFYKPADQCLGSLSLINVPFTSYGARKTLQRSIIVQAAYSDGERSGSAAAFVGGFILGGLVVGTLGCVYAPQISKALAGADRKDLMRKLPKFIYDEEKALEKTRKILTEKIAQLNSAIDDVSAQLHSEDAPNGAAVNSDELETPV